MSRLTSLIATTIPALRNTPMFTLPSLNLTSPLQSLSSYKTELERLLKSITSVKNQLCFHATLIRRHSQPFLFFLDNYKGAPHFKHWEKFSPYRRSHLQILLAVFEEAIEEVERDEEVLEEFVRSTMLRVTCGIFGWAKDVEEVILRWSMELRNRRLGRLVLDSWTQDLNDSGQPEGSGSCAIKDVVHLIAAVWEEEAERGYAYYYHAGETDGTKSSEAYRSEDDYYHYYYHNHDDKDEEGRGIQEEEEEEEEFEAWRPFKGPPCLKRKDALHLVFR